MSTLAVRGGKKNDARTENDAEEDDDDGAVHFDQTPVRVVCPHCGLSIITFIEHEASWVTYVVSGVLFLVLNWAALCIVPVVYPLFKDVVHHCPRCLNVLATRSRVVLPSFKQDVMSFRFGSCVVVLARKYVLMLVALTTIIGGLHWARSPGSPLTGVDAVQRTAVSPAGWEDFLRDCGFKSYLGNPIHVTLAFNEKYKNNTFRWEGAVHHIEEGLTLLWWSQRGALYTQMQPSQFPKREARAIDGPWQPQFSRREMPDLILLYDDGGELSKNASRLRRGTRFAFEATMLEVGRRGSPHLMMMWELQVLKGSEPRGKSLSGQERDGAKKDGSAGTPAEDASAPLNASQRGP